MLAGVIFDVTQRAGQRRRAAGRRGRGRAVNKRQRTRETIAKSWPAWPSANLLLHVSGPSIRDRPRRDQPAAAQISLSERRRRRKEKARVSSPRPGAPLHLWRQGCVGRIRAGGWPARVTYCSGPGADGRSLGRRWLRPESMLGREWDVHWRRWARWPRRMWMPARARIRRRRRPSPWTTPVSPARDEMITGSNALCLLPLSVHCTLVPPRRRIHPLFPLYYPPSSLFSFLFLRLSRPPPRVSLARPWLLVRRY